MAINLGRRALLAAAGASGLAGCQFGSGPEPTSQVESIIVVRAPQAAPERNDSSASGGGLRFLDLEVAPRSAPQLEPVAITVTVRNTGENARSVPLGLEVDGDRTRTKEIALAGGETDAVTFAFRTEIVGRYVVRAGGGSGEAPATGDNRLREGFSRFHGSERPAAVNGPRWP